MSGNHWGYGKEDGPSAWHRSYPVAKGNRQSPVDIIPQQAFHDNSLGLIIVNYDHCTSINISNNGHSVVVEFVDSDNRSGKRRRQMALNNMTVCLLDKRYKNFSVTMNNNQTALVKKSISCNAAEQTHGNVIQGGPLDNPYRLKQFHFHWGGKGCDGSEHTVAGYSYASELHLVHWNAVKYKTFAEAATAPDGLAVLGIFLETGDDHRWLHTITDALYMVKYKGSLTDFKGFNPKCLLPSSLHYWTYLGSLTTPPLHESVIWVVLKEPIVVSEKQMGKFRTLLFTGEEEDERIRMENNFRPPQPLSGRTVRSSN